MLIGRLGPAYDGDWHLLSELRERHVPDSRPVRDLHEPRLRAVQRRVGSNGGVEVTEMTLRYRLLYTFTTREIGMFGLGMASTGFLTFETADGFWAVLIGLLMVVLSAAAYWRGGVDRS